MFKIITDNNPNSCGIYELDIYFKIPIKLTETTFVHITDTLSKLGGFNAVVLTALLALTDRIIRSAYNNYVAKKIRAKYKKTLIKNLLNGRRNSFSYNIDDAKKNIPSTQDIKIRLNSFVSA